MNDPRFALRIQRKNRVFIVVAVMTLALGITATDPAAYAAVAGLLISVAIAACYGPARRAAQTDPLVALRDP